MWCGVLGRIVRGGMRGRFFRQRRRIIVILAIFQLVILMRGIRLVSELSG